MKIFLAHSNTDEDAHLLEESQLQVHLRDMIPGEVEIVGRHDIDEAELVGQLLGTKLVLHLISAHYPGDDDQLFWLQVVQAVKEYGIQHVPVLLRHRHENAWLGKLFDGDKQAMLLDAPLFNHPSGPYDAAYHFCDKLRTVLPQVDALAPDTDDIPAIDPARLQKALLEIDFIDQRTQFAHRFCWDKYYHFIYLGGTPECGHSLLLLHLQRAAGVYPGHAQTERVDLSVDPALPAEFSVWDRLVEKVFDEVTLQFLPAESRQPAAIAKLHKELLEEAARDRVFYLVFDNHQEKTLEKLMRFWREFKSGLPPANGQVPKARLFFFVVDRCGYQREECPLREEDLLQPAREETSALPLAPIRPMKKTLVLSWLHQQFDFDTARQLRQLLDPQLDELILQHRHIRTFILKLCELLFRKDVYQKLFGNENF